MRRASPADVQHSTFFLSIFIHRPWRMVLNVESSEVIGQPRNKRVSNAIVLPKMPHELHVLGCLAVGVVLSLHRPRLPPVLLHMERPVSR